MQVVSPNADDVPAAVLKDRRGKDTYLVQFFPTGDLYASFHLRLPRLDSDKPDRLCARVTDVTFGSLAARGAPAVTSRS